MGKQEFDEGDSNVVVRNQVVYGALPQDVIDRMGDTTLNLLTNEQTVIPAINELKSNLTDLIAKFGTVTEDTVTSYTGGSGIINIDIPKNSIMLAVVPSPDGERCVTQRGFNPNYSATQARYTYNVYAIYNSGSHYFLDKVFNTSVTFKYYYVTITA